MSLMVYDNLTRKKKPFEPVRAGQAGMYFCGMTVQDKPHVGHMRAAIVGDVLRRHMIRSGYKTTFVYNFTDVDDKIIVRATEECCDYTEIAQRNGSWIFCDEMYRGLELNGLVTLPSMVDVTERSLALAGLSKVHGLPGLRSGWLVVPDASLRAEILNWKFYTSICPPAPSEFLALAALQVQERLIKRSRGIIERNVGTADAFFSRWPELFTWRPPRAGSVALVGLHKPSAEAYCHHLAKTAGVLLLPSSCLGYGDEHVRMGFGRENFRQALAEFEEFLHSEQTGG